MKKLIACSAILCTTVSVRALPTYDNFSGYGAAGTWTEASGPPIVSYTTGAPLLGGQTAPSGESWIPYTNAPAADLYGTYYAGDFTGASSQNVAVVNYFASGQPGASDTVGYSVPGNTFPGPFVVGNDTSAYSVWTPGWSQTGETSPALQNYLGGVGACLQFASDVPGTTGDKVFVSFFADVPDCTGSFGTGQSLDHGYTAGFLNAAELPSPNSTVNQNVLPGYASYGSPAPILFAKFNMRDVNATQWRPGVGYLDSNANSDNAAAAAVTQKTIHFIVMSYEFNGGAGLDAIHVWVDPANNTFGAATAPAVGATSTPAAGGNLPDVGGFFFLANTQDGGATPNSGVMFNSLHIGTNWAYVTGGLQNTAAVNITTGVGATAVLPPPLAAGGVPITSAAWANSSGPCTGGRFSVNATTGALTISGVQAGDGDTYTVTATTPVAAANSDAAVTAQNVVVLTVLTSQTVSAAGTPGGQFTLNFTGPSTYPYRVWSTTSFNPNLPVLGSPGWTQVGSGNYTSGANSFVAPATGQTTYYTVTSP